MQVQHKREGAQFGASEIDPAALVTHPSAITINPATLGTVNSSGAINSSANSSNLNTGNSNRYSNSNSNSSSCIKL